MLSSSFSTIAHELQNQLTEESLDSSLKEILANTQLQNDLFELFTAYTPVDSLKLQEFLNKKSVVDQWNGKSVAINSDISKLIEDACKVLGTEPMTTFQAWRLAIATGAISEEQATGALGIAAIRDTYFSEQLYQLRILQLLYRRENHRALNSTTYSDAATDLLEGLENRDGGIIRRLLDVLRELDSAKYSPKIEYLVTIEGPTEKENVPQVAGIASSMHFEYHQQLWTKHILEAQIGILQVIALAFYSRVECPADFYFELLSYLHGQGDSYRTPGQIDTITSLSEAAQFSERYTCTVAMLLLTALRLFDRPVTSSGVPLPHPLLRSEYREFSEKIVDTYIRTWANMETDNSFFHVAYALPLVGWGLLLATEKTRFEDEQLEHASILSETQELQFWCCNSDGIRAVCVAAHRILESCTRHAWSDENNLPFLDALQILRYDVNDPIELSGALFGCRNRTVLEDCAKVVLSVPRYQPNQLAEEVTGIELDVQDYCILLRELFVVLLDMKRHLATTFKQEELLALTHTCSYMFTLAPELTADFIPSQKSGPLSLEDIRQSSPQMHYLLHAANRMNCMSSLPMASLWKAFIFDANSALAVADLVRSIGNSFTCTPPSTSDVAVLSAHDDFNDLDESEEDSGQADIYSNPQEEALRSSMLVSDSQQYWEHLEGRNVFARNRLQDPRLGVIIPAGTVGTVKALNVNASSSSTSYTICWEMKYSVWKALLISVLSSTAKLQQLRMDQLEHGVEEIKEACAILELFTACIKYSPGLLNSFAVEIFDKRTESIEIGSFQQRQLHSCVSDLLSVFAGVCFLCVRSLNLSWQQESGNSFNALIKLACSSLRLLCISSRAAGSMASDALLRPNMDATIASLAPPMSITFGTFKTGIIVPLISNIRDCMSKLMPNSSLSCCLLTNCISLIRNVLFASMQNEIMMNVQGAFALFDTDGSGDISTEEFAATLENAGFRLSPQAFETMRKQLDVNNDGSIAFDEFVSFIRHIQRTHRRSINLNSMKDANNDSVEDEILTFIQRITGNNEMRKETDMNIFTHSVRFLCDAFTQTTSTVSNIQLEPSTSKCLKRASMSIQYINSYCNLLCTDMLLEILRRQSTADIVSSETNVSSKQHGWYQLLCMQEGNSDSAAFISQRIRDELLREVLRNPSLKNALLCSATRLPVSIASFCNRKDYSSESNYSGSEPHLYSLLQDKILIDWIGQYTPACIHIFSLQCISAFDLLSEIISARPAVVTAADGDLSVSVPNGYHWLSDEKLRFITSLVSNIDPTIRGDDLTNPTQATQVLPFVRSEVRISENLEQNKKSTWPSMRLPTLRWIALMANSTIANGFRDHLALRYGNTLEDSYNIVSDYILHLPDKLRQSCVRFLTRCMRCMYAASISEKYHSTKYGRNETRSLHTKLSFSITAQIGEDIQEFQRELGSVSREDTQSRVQLKESGILRTQKSSLADTETELVNQWMFSEHDASFIAEVLDFARTALGTRSTIVGTLLRQDKVKRKVHFGANETKLFHAPVNVNDSDDENTQLNSSTSSAQSSPSQGILRDSAKKENPVQSLTTAITSHTVLRIVYLLLCNATTVLELRPELLTSCLSFFSLVWKQSTEDKTAAKVLSLFRNNKRIWKGIMDVIALSFPPDIPRVPRSESDVRQYWNDLCIALRQNEDHVGGGFQVDEAGLYCHQLVSRGLCLSLLASELQHSVSSSSGEILAFVQKFLYEHESSLMNVVETTDKRCELELQVGGASSGTENNHRDIPSYGHSILPWLAHAPCIVFPDSMKAGLQKFWDEAGLDTRPFWFSEGDVSGMSAVTLANRLAIETRNTGKDDMVPFSRNVVDISRSSVSEELDKDLARYGSRFVFDTAQLAWYLQPAQCEETLLYLDSLPSDVVTKGLAVAASETFNIALSLADAQLTLARNFRYFLQTSFQFKGLYSLRTTIPLTAIQTLALRLKYCDTSTVIKCRAALDRTGCLLAALHFQLLDASKRSDAPSEQEMSSRREGIISDTSTETKLKISTPHNFAIRSPQSSSRTILSDQSPYNEPNESIPNGAASVTNLMSGANDVNANDAISRSVMSSEITLDTLHTLTAAATKMLSTCTDILSSKQHSTESKRPHVIKSCEYTLLVSRLCSDYCASILLLFRHLQVHLAREASNSAHGSIKNKKTTVEGMPENPKLRRLRKATREIGSQLLQWVCDCINLQGTIHASSVISTDAKFETEAFSVSLVLAATICRTLQPSDFLGVLHSSGLLARCAEIFASSAKACADSYEQFALNWNESHSQLAELRANDAFSKMKRKRPTPVSSHRTRTLRGEQTTGELDEHFHLEDESVWREEVEADRLTGIRYAHMRMNAVLQLIFALGRHASGCTVMLGSGILHSMLYNTLWRHMESTLYARLIADAAGIPDYSVNDLLYHNPSDKLDWERDTAPAWWGFGYGLGPSLNRGYSSSNEPDTSHEIWCGTVRALELIIRTLGETAQDETQVSQRSAFSQQSADLPTSMRLQRQTSSARAAAELKQHPQLMKALSLQPSADGNAELELAGMSTWNAPAAPHPHLHMDSSRLSGKNITQKYLSGSRSTHNVSQHKMLSSRLSTSLLRTQSEREASSTLRSIIQPPSMSNVHQWVTELSADFVEKHYGTFSTALRTRRSNLRHLEEMSCISSLMACLFMPTQLEYWKHRTVSSLDETKQNLNKAEKETSVRTVRGHDTSNVLDQVNLAQQFGRFCEEATRDFALMLGDGHDSKIRLRHRHRTTPKYDATTPLTVHSGNSTPVHRGDLYLHSNDSIVSSSETTELNTSNPTLATGVLESGVQQRTELRYQYGIRIEPVSASEHEMDKPVAYAATDQIHRLQSLLLSAFFDRRRQHSVGDESTTLHDTLFAPASDHTSIHKSVGGRTITLNPATLSKLDEIEQSATNVQPGAMDIVGTSKVLQLYRRQLFGYENWQQEMPQHENTLIHPSASTTETTDEYDIPLHAESSFNQEEDDIGSISLADHAGLELARSSGAVAVAEEVVRLERSRKRKLSGKSDEKLSKRSSTPRVQTADHGLGKTSDTSETNSSTRSLRFFDFAIQLQILPTVRTLLRACSSLASTPPSLNVNADQIHEQTSITSAVGPHSNSWLHPSRSALTDSSKLSLSSAKFVLSASRAPAQVAQSQRTQVKELILRLSKLSGFTEVAACATPAAIAATASRIRILCAVPEAVDAGFAILKDDLQLAAAMGLPEISSNVHVANMPLQLRLTAFGVSEAGAQQTIGFFDDCSTMSSITSKQLWLNQSPGIGHLLSVLHFCIQTASHLGATPSETYSHSLLTGTESKHHGTQKTNSATLNVKTNKIIDSAGSDMLRQTARLALLLLVQSIDRYVRWPNMTQLDASEMLSSILDVIGDDGLALETAAAAFSRAAEQEAHVADQRKFARGETGRNVAASRSRAVFTRSGSSNSRSRSRSRSPSRQRRDSISSTSVSRYGTNSLMHASQNRGGITQSYFAETASQLSQYKGAPGSTANISLYIGEVNPAHRSSSPITHRFSGMDRRSQMTSDVGSFRGFGIRSAMSGAHSVGGLSHTTSGTASGALGSLTLGRIRYSPERAQTWKTKTQLLATVTNDPLWCALLVRYMIESLRWRLLTPVWLGNAMVEAAQQVMHSQPNDEVDVCDDKPSSMAMSNVNVGAAIDTDTTFSAAELVNPNIPQFDRMLRKRSRRPRPPVGDMMYLSEIKSDHEQAPIITHDSPSNPPSATSMRPISKPNTVTTRQPQPRAAEMPSALRHPNTTVQMSHTPNQYNNTAGRSKVSFDTSLMEHHQNPTNSLFDTSQLSFASFSSPAALSPTALQVPTSQ